MSSWVPRLNGDGPVYLQAEYTNYQYGGLNQYLARGSNGWSLPNCTAWASGRQLENGYGSYISPSNGFGNADSWYNAAVSFCDRGQEPQIGAIAVWRGGTLGAGHVAVIEQYDQATDTALFSNSDYSDSLSNWCYWNYKSGHNPSLGSGYTFLGYIYPAGNPKPSWLYPLLFKRRKKHYGRSHIKRRSV